jgi:tetratricopeptide (TPR) repeat protein
MNYFHRVLTIYNENLHLPHQNNVIGCYNRMGIMHRKRKEYEQAHNCFRHAIEIFSRTSLPERHSLLTQMYTNMGLTHKEQGDLDACLIDYKLAIKYTTDDSHELPKIQKAIETLMHEKNNNGQEESTMNVKKKFEFHRSR